MVSQTEYTERAVTVLCLCGCFNEHRVSDVCFPSLFSPSFFFSTSGDYILDAKPKEISEAQRLNYEQVRGCLQRRCFPNIWTHCRGICLVFRNLSRMRLSDRNASRRNGWSGVFSELYERDWRCTQSCYSHSGTIYTFSPHSHYSSHSLMLFQYG